jgi:anaerobic magnesium-protoporphyrin IX monomethyl ester cyclase
MRVLLIVYDNGSYVHTFPQGTAYIAAILQQHFHDVVIYNQDVHHYADEHLTWYLDNNDKFDVVGLGVIGGYWQYRKMLSISKAIAASKKRPNLYVLGGHGPSPCPDFFLKKSNADVIVHGEGEETIVELLDRIDNGKSYEDVQGTAYIKNGVCCINPRRPLCKIDSIPFPAYSLFPIEYYRLERVPNCTKSDFVMPVASARGCTFKCNFCYRMDKGFRPRNSEMILAEI